jgi:hypothetical protein
LGGSVTGYERMSATTCCACAASGRRAAEQHDELASLYSITSSARTSMSFLGALWLRRLSADEHDLAAGSGFKDLLMRAGRLGEWQFLTHDGA